MSRKKLEALRLAIELRDRQANNANHHAEKLEQRESEVERLIGELERWIEDATGLPCSIGAEPIPEGVDVDDPKTWRNGDVVECVVSTGGVGSFTVGREYRIAGVDTSARTNMPLRVIDDDNDEMWTGGVFRFVRRPS